MRNFHKMASGLSMDAIMAELTRKPELWNRHGYRKEYPGTPHGQVDDIWLRYSDDGKVADTSNTAAVQNDPGAVWHDEALELQSVKPLVLNLMRSVEAWTLERLMISRLRPGGQILPHADNTGVYVNQGNIARYHLVLQGLPGSLYRCGDETVQMLTGEVWWFNAWLEHEVINNSVDDRIHLMADVKFWPSTKLPVQSDAADSRLRALTGATA